MTIGYLYSKFFKKILRWKSIYKSRVDKTAKIYAGTEFHNSSIDRFSYVGYDCEIISCRIGSFCSIANRVIIGGAKHPLGWVSTSPTFYNVSGGTGRHLGNLQFKPSTETIIDHDVWIGSRAIILQGVRIGTGAVIGAGAVVTKDVPPYAIVAGNPAKVIRFRFDSMTIEKFLDSEWWDLPTSKLSEISKYMNHPGTFLSEINRIPPGGVNDHLVFTLPAYHADERRAA